MLMLFLLILIIMSVELMCFSVCILIFWIIRKVVDLIEE